VHAAVSNLGRGVGKERGDDLSCTTRHVLVDEARMVRFGLVVPFPKTQR
jgi:hypothetical protein